MSNRTRISKSSVFDDGSSPTSPVAEEVIDDVEMSMESDSGERLARDNDRGSRESERRQTTNATRGLTKSELIAKFRSEMFNNVLPETPQIPGYHLCWLSTTNAYDSIQHREALGYERVKPEDLPGLDHITLTQGSFVGCIGLNELVLFKVPMDLWREYMSIAHHERPFGEEEKIRDAVRYVQETAREGGGDVYLGNGTSEIGRSRRQPTFNE